MRSLFIRLRSRRLYFVHFFCACLVLTLCYGAGERLSAQTYRADRWQDGRPLRQGKFLISAGWSLFGVGYSVDPLGVENNPPALPYPEDPSLGSLGIGASVGIAENVDFGFDINGVYGGPSVSVWSKAALLPYSSPFQIALLSGIGYSYAELRYPLENDIRPFRLTRGSLFVSDVSVPISFDIDNEWTIFLAPRLMYSTYNAGVGWDSLAPNGLNVATLTEVQAAGWLYGFTIGAKAVRPSPEWWQYLLPVPFWASGAMTISVTWHQSGTASWSLGYQHLFPSFGALLTTLTQEEMDNIQSERAQKDSILALQKRQIELERTRFGRALSAEIVGVKGLGDSATAQESPTLRVEEFEAVESTPLLPYIFFERESAVIPSRYRRLRAADRASFAMDYFGRLKPSEMYRNILNIVGKRMTDNPEATLVLEGARRKGDASASAEEIALRRAQAVADYLMDVWKISPQRCTIRSREYPEQTDADEWQRVEISSSSPEICADVRAQEIIRRATPERIEFGFDIAAGAGVKQWNFEITQFDAAEARTLKMETGTDGNVEKYVWNVGETRGSVPSSGENIVARLEITDITNRVAESALALVPVEYISLDDKRRAAQADVKIAFLQRWTFGLDGEQTLPDSASIAEIQRLRQAVEKSALASSLSSRVIARSPLSRERLAKLSAALGAPVLDGAPQTPQTFSLIHPEDRYYARLLAVEIQTPTTTAR